MFIATISSDEPEEIAKILERVSKDVLNGYTGRVGMSGDTNYEYQILPAEQFRKIQHWFDYCEPEII